ncbi:MULTISPECIES: hypothetical protein [Rhizobium]|uniref:hypothetical protein n=1 Tax=Rhizobium TaxID=379 RepID=UPI0010309634|nr:MULTISPECIES: hypothetical protein [Rhizobium]TAX51863.1 hypothetical protein ELH99_17625 [Rhizobium leguminosarum]TBB35997.1 hypothetical protein ELH46_37670 [Rhizobium ruizarguesonis]TCB17947.1 hypothetical protein E0J18_12820 [Rhizobium leguminosarum bv. viciae]
MSDAWLGQNPRELVRSLRQLADDLEKLASGALPVVQSKAVKIRDYSLSNRAVPCLVGRMSGHPNIRDGAAGITTEIYYANEQQQLVRTFNRFYRLVGDPL